MSVSRVYTADIEPPRTASLKRGRPSKYPFSTMKVGDWFTLTRDYPDDGDLVRLRSQMSNTLRSCARFANVRISVSYGVDSDSGDVRFNVKRVA